MTNKKSGVVIPGKRIQHDQGGIHTRYLSELQFLRKKSEPHLAKHQHVKKLCAVSI